jgi:hypothetical protein
MNNSIPYLLLGPFFFSKSEQQAVDNCLLSPKLTISWTIRFTMATNAKTRLLNKDYLLRNRLRKDPAEPPSPRSLTLRKLQPARRRH